MCSFSIFHKVYSIHIWLPLKQLKFVIEYKHSLINSQRFVNYTKSSYVPKCFDTFKSCHSDSHEKHFSHFCWFVPPFCTNFVKFFTTSHQIYINFYLYKLILFLFSHHVACTNSTISYGALALILCVYLFYMICIVYIYYSKA